MGRVMETRLEKGCQTQQDVLHLIGQSPEMERREGWECELKVIAPGTSWPLEAPSDLLDCWGIGRPRRWTLLWPWLPGSC